MSDNENTVTPLSGDDAINLLKVLAVNKDQGASSHWEAYLPKVRISAGTLEQEAGFGTLERNPTWLKSRLHHMAQTPWRSKAASYPQFARFDKAASQIARLHDRAYDLDLLRQAITVACLQKHLPWSKVKTACVIGDGYGALSTLLSWCAGVEKVVMINLNKVLLVDVLFSGKVLDPDAIAVARTASEFEAAYSDDNIQIVAVPADFSSCISGHDVDLFLNIASFQEMTLPQVESYMNLIYAGSAREHFFYCANRLEKTLPDGSTTRFLDYPWRAEDEIILDEPCPWHQNYYAFRPPFLRKYDGVHQHRLIRMMGN